MAVTGEPSEPHGGGELHLVRQRRGSALEQGCGPPELELHLVAEVATRLRRIRQVPVYDRLQLRDRVAFPVESGVEPRPPHPGAIPMGRQ